MTRDGLKHFFIYVRMSLQKKPFRFLTITISWIT